MIYFPEIDFGIYFHINKIDVMKAMNKIVLTYKFSIEQNT